MKFWIVKIKLHSQRSCYSHFSYSFYKMRKYLAYHEAHRLDHIKEFRLEFPTQTKSQFQDGQFT
jgi:hypothetical protein